MSEETIFREVDEELRRDRMRTGWRRYGPYLIGAAVLVVLLVAANEGWNWWQNSNSARSSDQFYAALDLENGGDLAGAQKALDQLVAQGSGQYPVLAKFKLAGLLAAQGKKDEALAAYDALASGAGNQRLKNLALLLGANTLVDKGDVAGVKQRVQGLFAPDEPLRNSAHETLGLAQYKANDLNGARDSFEAVINDPAASQEARGRLQLYLAQLVAQGATPPATAQTADSAAAAGAAAVSAAAGTPPAAANDNAAAPAAAAAPASSAPSGVESSQPSTPDAALDLAVPSAPPGTAPPAPDAPVLSTGAAVPSVSSDTAQPAPLPGTVTEAPASTATPPAAAPTPAAPATGTSGQ